MSKILHIELYDNNEQLIEKNVLLILMYLKNI